MAWQPLRDLRPHAEATVAALFTDLDDTLTTDGRLPARAYRALERLHEASIPVVIVTGRPAGWCDLLARLWPVAGVVGENGALAYRYDPATRRMERRYAQSEAERAEGRRRLEDVRGTVAREVPGSAVAADQPFRMFDLAIDFAEDVGPLPREDVDRIRDVFAQHGAQAKVSSIHVNGWFGTFDKLTMILAAAEAWWGWKGALSPDAIYVGDSPNDEPAFEAFPRSVGVANVRAFADRMLHPPTFVTEGEGGAGFAELVDHLLGSGS